MFGFAFSNASFIASKYLAVSPAPEKLPNLTVTFPAGEGSADFVSFGASEALAGSLGLGLGLRLALPLLPPLPLHAASIATKINASINVSVFKNLGFTIEHIPLDR